ncbi:MAG: tetratricopeptide repeat protein [Planctomycetota bacterium]
MKKVVEKDPSNFEANLRMAEILIHVGNSGTTEDQIERAIKHLCRAKQIRPESSRAWLLLSWAWLKQSEISSEDSQLGRAIGYAKTALEKAMDYMDLNGMVQAKTLLADLLLKRASRSQENRIEDLGEANRLCGEVADEFEGILDRHRSDYLVVHALVRLAQGDTDYDDIEKMIKRAQEMDPNNAKSYEAQAKLVDARSHGTEGEHPVLP